MHRIVEQSGSRSPLDDAAGIHDSDSSAISATMPRLCVMNITAMPSSRGNSSIKSRICAWIVTSSAVVGSSAIRSARVASQRHRDHDALAHAAGQLVRIVRRPLLRRGDAAHGAASRRRVRAASPGSPGGRRSASTIWSPTVSTGLSDVIGSWNTIARRLPRTEFILLVRVREVLAVDLERVD